MSGSRLDRWLSIAAGVGAVCAVGVSLYQASLAREQQRASAWPYLQQANSFVVGQPYTRQVENVGIGPARIGAFEVLVDGKPVRNWADAVRALAQHRDTGLVYSSFGRGSVLPAGRERVLLRLPSSPMATEFFVGAQTRLETVVCYCSVYDECWQSDTRLPEPVPVRACVEDSTRAFRN